VLLNRLQDAVDHTLRDEQAGFRRRRSCIEQVFTLWNIIEQSLEHQQDLIINFIDFKKAFDSVHRPSLCRKLWNTMTFVTGWLTSLRHCTSTPAIRNSIVQYRLSASSFVLCKCKLQN